MLFWWKSSPIGPDQSMNFDGHLQSKAPVYDSVQLVRITPISLWFMVPITIVFMGFINHRSITGGPHIVP